MHRLVEAWIKQQDADTYDENPLEEYDEIAHLYRIEDRLGIEINETENYDVGAIYFTQWKFPWVTEAEDAWEKMVQLTQRKQYPVTIRMHEFDDVQWNVVRTWWLQEGEKPYTPDLDVDMFPEVEFE